MEELNGKMPASIEIGTVRYIADLIRLRIDEDDAKLFSQQFSQIIEYFQLLNEIDTDGVNPANEDWPIHNVFREDEVQPSMSREEFLRNAPWSEGVYVKVPQIFNEK